MNGSPGSGITVTCANCKAILAQHPDWRPDLSKGTPNDGSSCTLSRLSPHEVEIVHLDATALLELIHRANIPQWM
ncbi:hypothetical protein BS47DRAFT_1341348 [Hydnum rufescens UP504]|uniref:Uncharacterized protein n=1 Tax=Hydnum rufescens UP504 TaxID=1448309 RepID=A0A9P6DYJ5_9AGAM|nr:hypothetical protein BS47DRAFT_1341348 [Hydnum rufescens UP504]